MQHQGRKLRLNPQKEEEESTEAGIEEEEVEGCMQTVTSVTACLTMQRSVRPS